MKRLVVMAALLAGMGQAPPPTPETQALGATIMSCVQEGVALRTQIFTLQAEVERLKAEAAKVKPQ